MLKHNFFVINCTVEKPNLEIENNSYVELRKEEIKSYSKTISYFLNSDCVVSIANVGGITTHLCNEANFLLLGSGGWVDNNKFGFDSDNILSARKKIKNLETHKIDDKKDFNSIIKFLKTQTSPNENKLTFFDESKIKYLEI